MDSRGHSVGGIDVRLRRGIQYVGHAAARSDVGRLAAVRRVQKPAPAHDAVDRQHAADHDECNPRPAEQGNAFVKQHQAQQRRKHDARVGEVGDHQRVAFAGGAGVGRRHAHLRDGREDADGQ